MVNVKVVSPKIKYYSLQNVDMAKKKKDVGKNAQNLYWRKCT